MPHCWLGCDHRPMSDRTTVDLAERHSHDLEVVLWWGRRSGRFWVLVTDRHSGHTKRVSATAGNALDVFHHPFAYQAEAA